MGPPLLDARFLVAVIDDPPLVPDVPLSVLRSIDGRRLVGDRVGCREVIVPGLDQRSTRAVEVSNLAGYAATGIAVRCETGASGSRISPYLNGAAARPSRIAGVFPSVPT